MAYIRGLMDWQVARSDDGHRTYTADFLIDLESLSLGPAAVLQCPGLPLPGSFWSVGSDIDVYAKWRWGGSVRKHDAPAGEPTNLYVLTMSASTKAERRDNSGNSGGSGGGGQGNPLDVKPSISGSSVKYQEEDPTNDEGREIKTRAGELIRGPAVEWDKSRFNISIEIKQAYLAQGPTLAILDHLNDAPLWGFPARSIKFSSYGFERLYYNDSYVYYSIRYEFEVRTRVNEGEFLDTQYNLFELVGDWDRWIREEGTMVWMGKWVKVGTTMEYQRSKILGVNIPLAIRFVDTHGQPARTLLKDGLPYVPNPADLTYKPDHVLATTDAALIARYPFGPPVRHYKEANFLTLALPLTL